MNVVFNYDKYEEINTLNHSIFIFAQIVRECNLHEKSCVTAPACSGFATRVLCSVSDLSQTAGQSAGWRDGCSCWVGHAMA